VILAAVAGAPIRAEAQLFTDTVSSQAAFDWEHLPTDTADLAAEAKPMLRPHP
jgi:hypothetical protein